LLVTRVCRADCLSAPAFPPEAENATDLGQVVTGGAGGTSGVAGRRAARHRERWDRRVACAVFLSA
jgi:hypothetical protein